MLDAEFVALPRSGRNVRGVIGCTVRAHGDRRGGHPEVGAFLARRPSMMSASNQTRRRRLVRVILSLVGLGLFVALVATSGTKALSSSLHPRPQYLALMFAATVVVFLAASLRWGSISNALAGRKLFPFAKYFQFHAATRMLALYVSDLGGDLVGKSVILRGFGDLPIGVSAKAAVWNKAFDLLLAALLSIPAALYAFRLVPVPWVFAIAAASLAAFFALSITGVLGSLLNLGARCLRALGRRIPIKALRLRTLPEGASEDIRAFSRQNLAVLCILTVAKYAALLARLVFLSEALELGLPISALAVGLPLSSLTLLLAFTPGGLGVLEGGWYGILALLGIPTEAIGPFLLGRRVYLMLIFVLVAALTYTPSVVLGICRRVKARVPR